jgi:PAS domain S-box-containing protein
MNGVLQKLGTACFGLTLCLVTPQVTSAADGQPTIVISAHDNNPSPYAFRDRKAELAVVERRIADKHVPGTETPRIDSEKPLRRFSTVLLIVIFGVLALVAWVWALRRQVHAKTAQLLESRNLLQSIIDNTTAVIFVKDRSGRFLLVNRRFDELFHIARNGAVGRTDFDLFPRERAMAFRAYDERVLAAGSVLEEEEIVPHDDGLHTYISIKYPLFDQKGEAFAVCGIATDITERKRAEEAARESYARIQHLVRSNIIAVFFWDTNGNITEANDAFLRMLGYSREDLSVGAVRWMDMTPPEYRRITDKAMEELKLRGVATPYEKEYIRKDGSRVPVLIGSALFEGSKETGVAYLLDLSERKQAEAEREARRAAEAANRAKSVFLANMSHELRTPLNAILGYAQILRHDSTLSERQRSGLNIVEQSGEHLLTLINDILDIAKIEAGRLELVANETILAKSLRTICDIIRIKAAQKGLAFTCNLAPDLPFAVCVDEKRLRQVLLNLLSNAVRFTDHGEICLNVEFSPSRRLRFEVKDTGIGIDKNHWETIFQPFEQAADMKHRTGGTGLGLAISRQLVRLMGGDIHVDSRVGEGSRFWFELDVPLVEAQACAECAGHAATGYGGARRRILVVDDAAGNRSALADALSPLGFDVYEAPCGDPGQEAAQRLRPDLILMDLTASGTSGLEALRGLRRQPDLVDVPIIAFSAATSGSDAAASLEAGANAFLPKPVDFGSLLTEIALLLEIEWTYDRAIGETDVSEPMLVPPVEQMETLHYLARLGNMRDIVYRAEQIVEQDERYRPFANRLRVLAEGYQSKAVLNLIERYLEQASKRSFGMPL